MNISSDRKHSRQLLISAFDVVWLLAIMLVTSGCHLSTGLPSLSQLAEDAFKATIGIPVEPQVRLLTEKDRYQREDWIGVWVENKTNHVLWFTDQALGLRAYQYDEQKASWHSVDLGSKLANPRMTSVTPGPRSPLPSDSVPVKDIRASGRIRLVITGATDQGQLFIAYKDIEIVD
jgi:hypothetical protein